MSNNEILSKIQQTLKASHNKDVLYRIKAKLDEPRRRVHEHNDTIMGRIRAAMADKKN